MAIVGTTGSTSRMRPGRSQSELGAVPAPECRQRATAWSEVMMLTSPPEITLEVRQN